MRAYAQGLTVLARNWRPSKRGALSQSPTSFTANPAPALLLVHQRSSRAVTTGSGVEEQSAAGAPSLARPRQSAGGRSADYRCTPAINPSRSGSLSRSMSRRPPAPHSRLSCCRVVGAEHLRNIRRHLVTPHAAFGVQKTAKMRAIRGQEVARGVL